MPFVEIGKRRRERVSLRRSGAGSRLPSQDTAGCRNSTDACCSAGGLRSSPVGGSQAGDPVLSGGICGRLGASSQAEGVVRSIAELVEHQQVRWVRKEDSVLETAQRMAEWKVGAVMVLDGERLVGIFSERDLMTRVVCKGLSPADTPVGKVMTPNPVVVDTHSTVEQCLRIMNQAKCRHLPVVHDGRLVGILSIRDLLQSDIRQKDDEIEMMRAFIHYVPPSTPTGSGR